MKRLLLGMIGGLVFSIAHASVTVKEVSYRGDDGSPALSPMQYRNPVLAGFYPDPSAIRVGDDFYLVNSSFGYFPGLPIFHSRDLVSWTQIGNAIDRPGQIDFGHHELTRGLFAASISHHGDTFYISNTCFYCDGGNYVITAKNPAGRGPTLSGWTSKASIPRCSSMTMAAPGWSTTVCPRASCAMRGTAQSGFSSSTPPR